jgi:PAS domain S-box-containing protein
MAGKSRARGELIRGAEFRVRRLHSDREWIGRYTATPITDANGAVALVVVSIEDLTERRQLETALRQSEERTRSLVESNIIGIISADIYGNVSEANAEFLRLVGYTQRELHAGTLRLNRITPPEHWPKDERAVAEAQLMGACRPYEKEYLRPDGRRVPVLVGFALVGEQRERSVAFTLDLTLQKAAEEALRRSEQRYRSLISTVASIVWIAGPTGEFQEPQLAWEAYTGQPFADHRGLGWIEVIHAEDREHALNLWQDAVENRSRFACSGRVWHAPSGQYRYFEARAVPILEPSGAVREWVGTAIDVHEHRLAEKAEQNARREAEAANRAKDEFLAVLSHELRTPLTPAFLSIDELMEMPQVPEAIRSELAVVRRNLGHETKLIDDLLDMTRIQSGKLELRWEVVDLHEVLRDTARDCMNDCRNKNLELGLELKAEQFHVRGDSVRLRQVFWNLLRNSVKFTPAGGIVELGTYAIDGRLVVSVRDTGIGIPAEKLPRLFDRFEQGGTEVTRRFGGLGLGLAITKSLVELHGASIEASSRGPGEGATFRVHLRTVPAAPRVERITPAVAKPAPSGVRILLVEDHDDTRVTLARLLKRQGHDVLSAGSVASALIVARARGFDLLVSDIGLPDGDGFDLLRQLPPGHTGDLAERLRHGQGSRREQSSRFRRAPHEARRFPEARRLDPGADHAGSVRRPSASSRVRHPAGHAGSRAASKKTA